MSCHTSTAADDYDPADVLVDISESQLRRSLFSTWCLVPRADGEEEEEFFEDTTAQRPSAPSEAKTSSFYTAVGDGEVPSAFYATAQTDNYELSTTAAPQEAVNGHCSAEVNVNVDSAQEDILLTQSSSLVSAEEFPAQEALASSNNNNNNDNDNNNNNSIDAVVNDVQFILAEYKRFSVDNAALRTQLTEASYKIAHYMHLCNLKDEEIKNVHKTLSLLMRDGGNNFLNSSCEMRDTKSEGEEEEDSVLSAHSEHEDVWNRQEPNAIKSVFVPRFLPLFERHQQARFSFADDALEESDGGGVPLVAGEWESHFASAKQHARNGEAVPAMESLLLAITSDDFGAWDSLLARDPEWNKLSECDRQRWDAFLVEKVAEILKERHVDCGGGTPPPGARGESDGAGSFGGGENGPLRPELIAPFIWQMSAKYEQKSGGHTTAQAATRGEVAPQQYDFSQNERICEKICTALEKLLLLSLSVFPKSADLFYLLAALRAKQKRNEEAMGLLQQVVAIDPSFPLCITAHDAF